MSNPSGWRILLIDDEADILSVVGMTLTDAGYRVETAADGEEGLVKCAENLPDIVITDIRMPKMDGIQVLSHIKRNYPAMEVIVATAFGEMDVAVAALRLDASDFITKPIATDTLMIAVERAKSRSITRKKIVDYTAWLEQGLEESYRFQQKLIESSMDGILGCDNDELIVTFNRSMAAMLDYRPAEVLNRRRLEDFMGGADYAVFKTDLQNQAFGGPDRLLLYETRMTTADKEDVPVQVSAEIIKENGIRQGLVCFVRDLRRIRRIERQMADQAHVLHQDKMMSLGRLSASVAHEINNPLAGVLNYVRLMRRITAAGTLPEKMIEKFRSYLSVVEKEVDRCARIVGNLLTFSRKADVIYEKVDLSDLVTRCMILSGHRLELNNIEVKIDIKTPVPAVEGDSNQLQQCLINLIFNAADAMPTGGCLEIVIHRSDDGKEVFLHVSDTGCGIDAGDMPHIFEPFFTTKKQGQGTGLGLSTTYGIIAKHHGKIDVSSRPEEKTTFTITLPAVR